MTDGEYTLMILMVLMVLYIGYLQLTLRHTRDKLKTAQQSASVPGGLSSEEADKLRERVQVLERITVDKENSLSREIEELRHA